MKRWLLLWALLPGLLLSGGLPVGGLPVGGLPVGAQPVQQGSVQTTAVPRSAQEILSDLLRSQNLPRDSMGQVQVVKSNAINAYTDGFNIYLTEPLWNGLRTNDERAFVIAHELAHIQLRHVQVTQMRRIGLSLLNQLVLERMVPANSLLDLADDIGLNLIDKRFSRQAEFQADDLGLRLMRQAGYRPQAAIGVFNFLKAQSNGGMPEFLSTHPISESRIKRLAQRYQISQR
jgi:predicted Zn-dependent protease